ncbi:hypothetical protein LJB42_002730 [Komagataella kurtzmanii]|nr:hypothetical protein LJB42_002730 [Komagataella kurtzmanii]
MKPHHHAKSRPIGSYLYFGVFTVALVFLTWRNYDSELFAQQVHTKDIYDPQFNITLPIDGPTFTPSKNYSISVQNAAVASDIELCSKLGVSILQQGGNAADSAVTVALCIGTINSYSSGIGGGGFIVSKLIDNATALSFDCREMAPSKSFKEMFNYHEEKARVGGLAVAIPGELKGLYELFQHHGSGNVEWKDLILPVAELAEVGWTVDPLFSSALKSIEHHIYEHSYDWAFALNEDGKIKKRGDWINRPMLATTLRRIAESGNVDLFYDPESDIVQSMVNATRKYGGILEAPDFAKYIVRIEESLTLHNFTSDGLTVYTSNGASSGLVLLAGLKLMDLFEDFKEFHNDFGAVESQRLVETMKWMASVRSNLGDLNIYSTNETEIDDHRKRYHRYKSDEWGIETHAKINDSHTLPSWKDYAPAFLPNDPHGTSHFSIVDQYGNAVAMTTTVNLGFGSKIHDPISGVILNDEMDDFSVPTSSNAFGLHPSIYNWVEPYKRPLSSCAPTIIVDSLGLPHFVIGAAGGSKITTTVLQAIIRVYHYHLDLLDVIAYPRFHHQLLPEEVLLEFPRDNELIRHLKERGHDVRVQAPISTMNGILRKSGGSLIAVSDHWRKLGRPWGF